MAKNHAHPDVLVLGEHPSAYFAAALMRHKSKWRIMHSTVPGESFPERLVLLNPQFFALHELLKPLERKIDARPIYGLQFLSDDLATRSEHRSKSTLATVASYREVRDALRHVAQKEEVEFINPRELRILRLDEEGVEVSFGHEVLKPKALILAASLGAEQERLLGLPDAWDHGILHRYSFVRLRAAKSSDPGLRALVPMSLDLRGMLAWAWLLPGRKCMQLAVEQPVEMLGQVAPARLLEHWVDVLRRGELIEPEARLPSEGVESVDMPLAGALAHEGVANRTLLIGPAGGFYSSSGEDIYPNCWSAVFAADALKKALRERHLQDALQIYRQKWRTTLGEYLRGPQQNLRFLLPLVYRNQVMTSRLAEAILMGKSVVR